jgi:hypothetical protein
MSILRTSILKISHFALMAFAVLSLLMFLVPTAFADEPAHAQSELTAIAGLGTGQVIVSPTSQDQGTFAVEIAINIHNAQPNTTFSVRRAPDLVPNGICTGTTYIPFGETFTTSAGGAGATQFHFERGAPFVSGVQFDVVFQVIGSDGSVLQSECMTVTVK